MSHSSPFFRFWIAFTTAGMALWAVESSVKVDHETHVLALFLMAASAAVAAWRVPVYSYRFRFLGALTQLVILAAPFAAIVAASQQGFLPQLAGRTTFSYLILGAAMLTGGGLSYLAGRKAYRRARRIAAIRVEREHTHAYNPSRDRADDLDITQDLPIMAWASQP